MPVRSSRWSLDGGPGDGGRLAAGEQPTGRDGRPRYAHDHEDEVQHGYPTEIAEVVEVRRSEGEIGAGDAEERAQEGERAGGGGGQRPADPACGSGRGQRAKVAGRLAADEPHGHGEDAERQKGACARRDGDELRVGG